MATLYSNALISISNSSNETITVEASNGITSEETIINSGTSSQKNKYLLKGQITTNTKTRIATVKIKTFSGRYFTSKPIIKSSNKSILTTSTIVTKTEENTLLKPKISEYTIYIYYKGSRTVFNQGSITCDIKYKTKSQKAPIGLTNETNKVINRIAFGVPNLPANESTREIRVYGTPGAIFALAVNQGQIDGYGDFGEIISSKHNDVSILSKFNKTSTTYHDYAKEMPILKGVIGKKGYYSFKQVFPSNTEHRDVLTTSGSGKTIMDIVDNTKVKKADRIFIRQLPSDSTRKVTDVSALNTTQFNINANMTGVPSGATVSFKRNKIYNIDIIPDLSSTLNLPPRNPTYRLFQYLDVDITVKVSTTNSVLQINGGSGGANLETTYSGQALSKGRIISNTLTLTTTGSETFSSSSRTPIFSRVNNKVSNWKLTSSLRDHVNWGGSAYDVDNSRDGVIDVKKITSTLGGAAVSTLTLTFDLVIKRFPKNDMTIDLNLDDIITTDTP